MYAFAQTHASETGSRHFIHCSTSGTPAPIDASKPVARAAPNSSPSRRNACHASRHEEVFALSG